MFSAHLVHNLASWGNRGLTIQNTACLAREAHTNKFQNALRIFIRNIRREFNPTICIVASKRAVTKKGVPKGARRLWAQCLIQAISAAVIFNSTASWEDLYALPKCVLRAQERGGKGRNRGEVESK